MDEEMSLREMIEIILNGKHLIIGITAAALIIGAILTFFPKPAPTTRTYRAEAKIRIEQLSQESFTPSTGGYFSTLITALMNAERYNAEAFAEMVKHPDLLAGVRTKLSLDEQGIKSGYLTKDLEVTVNENNTAITIAFSHTDPEFAQKTVNTVSEEFREFLAERQRERIDLVASNLERLIALELQGLKSTLQRLEETRANFEPLITYRDDSHVTPEYNVLSNDIARTISQIAQLEAQGEEIKDFRVQVALVLRKVDDWVIFTPSTQAIDVTPEPTYPRTINIAIAGTLGLMISVFFVFFLNYWKESAPTTVAK